MDKLISAFQQTPGESCIATALSSYFKYQGWYNLSEAETWLLTGGGLGLYYFQPPSGSCQTSSAVHRYDEDWKNPLRRLIPRVRNHCFDLRNTTRDYLQIEISKQSMDGQQAAWEYTRSLLNAGLPQIVEVDIFYLPTFSYYYQKTHLWHLVTLLGYQDDSVFISEPHWQGTINRLDLMAARDSLEYEHHKSGKINNTWWQLTGPQNPAPIDAQLYRKVLFQAANYALTDQTLPGSMAVTGSQAGQMFLEEIGVWQATRSETDLILIMENMFHQLSRPESPAYCYKLTAEILSTLAKEEENAPWVELAQECSHLSQQWKQLALIFLKGSKRKPSQSLTTVASLLLALLTKEQALLGEMREALSVAMGI